MTSGNDKHGLLENAYEYRTRKVDPREKKVKEVAPNISAQVVEIQQKLSSLNVWAEEVINFLCGSAEGGESTEMTKSGGLISELHAVSQGLISFSVKIQRLETLFNVGASLQGKSEDLDPSMPNLVKAISDTIESLNSRLCEIIGVIGHTDIPMSPPGQEEVAYNTIFDELEFCTESLNRTSTLSSEISRICGVEDLEKRS